MAAPKVTKSLIYNCLSCVKPTDSTSQFCQRNLDSSSFDLIWAIFAEGLEGHLVQAGSSCLFDRLLPFAYLPLIGVQPNLYQLYLITKPTANEESNYNEIMMKSTAILISLIWNKIRTLLNLSNHDQVAQRKFGLAALQKELSQLEIEGQILLGWQASWEQRRQIINSYGFSLSQTFFPFNSEFRKTQDWPTYLYSEAQRHTYYWPWLKNLVIMNEVFIPDTGQHLVGNRLDFRGPMGSNWLGDSSVPSQVQTRKLITQMLTSDHLFPFRPLSGYRFIPIFQAQVGQWLLAETILRGLTWRFLRVFFLRHHQLLVLTLTIDDLIIIYRAVSLCDIVIITHRGQAWETLVADIGDILLSRSLQEIILCSPVSEQAINEEKKEESISRKTTQAHLELVDPHGFEVDSEKDSLRRWFLADRDYALVALANNLLNDGRVDICALQLQITARRRTFFP